MTMIPRTPLIDDNSLAAVQEAIEYLALLRGICCPLTDPDHPADPATALHLAWTLTLQIDAYLPHLIATAHAHHYTHDEIRALLTTPPTAPPPLPTVTNPCPLSDINTDRTDDNQRG